MTNTIESIVSPILRNGWKLIKLTLNSPDREPYGVTDTFFNITFDRNIRKFVHHENAINKLVSSCTKNRADFQLVNSLIHQENQS